VFDDLDDLDVANERMIVTPEPDPVAADHNLHEGEY
jgi:hypothetical protein